MKKFTRKRPIEKLEEGIDYIGTIYSIVDNGIYYKITIALDNNIITIWANNNINPDSPLFDVFDAFIENEEDAEEFDEQELVGREINFTVKNVAVGKKKIVRSFFKEVNLADSNFEDDFEGNE